MKNLFLICLLLISNSTVLAGSYNVAASFGTQGSSSDVNIGVLNETISIAGFDSSLGYLTGVNITVFGQIDSEGSSQNLSVANGRADIGIYLFTDWKVTTTAANHHTFLSSSLSPFLSGSSSAPGVYTMIPGGDDTFDYDFTTGELSSALNGINLSEFISGSVVDFIFSAWALTFIANEVESGTGEFTNVFSTGSWGKVEVTYTYAEVPEPTSITLMIFALILLISSGKHFKANKNKQYL